MGQSFLRFEQLLLQTTADLLNRRAEIQQLKDSIRAAEAFKRSRAMLARGKPVKKIARNRDSKIAEVSVL